ncbi:hypothetical protein [Deinococcus planocerae]|uniref:hypothetical protein n=1 Tax=Deinococcus planocerae TaxID=1737569 RepID=UPI000C7E9968|nr:hypothetical protein [Deinococcus planocerae]
MNSSTEPRNRWAALGDLLQRGALYGVGFGAVCALLGLLLFRNGLASVLAGFNFAGTALCVLAGAMALGASRTAGAEATARGKLGRAAPGIQWPLAPMLVALIAAGVCFGLAWVGGLWR